MTHELVPDPARLDSLVCTVCGRHFPMTTPLATIEATPCALPPVLYTLSPLTPRQTTDAIGAKLLDNWLKEWGGE